MKLNNPCVVIFVGIRVFYCLRDYPSQVEQKGRMENV